MDKSFYIFDATHESFGELVLGNSRKGPVLVNYWSPGAGPCLKLWPVLEKLANEYAGRFLLVNVNTDKYAGLARDYGVNSVPTVKVFRDEKAVEVIHGAHSEAAFRALIDRYIARPSDAAVVEAVTRYQQGDTARAFLLLQQAAGADPGNTRIPITHAKLLFQTGDYAQAEQLLRSLPGQLQKQEEVSTLLAHLGFVRTAQGAPGLEDLEQAIAENPEDLEARYQLSAIKLLEDDYEPAMQQLLEIIRRDRDFDEGVGYKGMMAIFTMLGKDSELVQRYRQRMLDLAG